MSQLYKTKGGLEMSEEFQNQMYQDTASQIAGKTKVLVDNGIPPAEAEQVARQCVLMEAGIRQRFLNHVMVDTTQTEEYKAANADGRLKILEVAVDAQAEIILEEILRPGREAVSNAAEFVKHKFKADLEEFLEGDV